MINNQQPQHVVARRTSAALFVKKSCSNEQMTVLDGTADTAMSSRASFLALLARLLDS